MKLKNALKKIIHSVCLISVLFLSVFFVLPPVEVYADTTRLYVSAYSGYSPYTIQGFINGSWTTVETGEYNANYYLDSNVIYRITCQYRYAFDSFDGNYLSTDIDNPTHLSNVNNAGWSRVRYGYLGTYNTDTWQYFVLYNYVAPTPTPTPTPTPAPPSSPTPDANAEAFFGKLGSDAQNGFGAILTAWTAANSHFYTSVLFIVLPVFLGIVGLIASFFFGGGDDD